VYSHDRKVCTYTYANRQLPFHGRYSQEENTEIEYWGENEEEKLAKKAKILEMRSQGVKIVRIAEALNIHSGSVVYVINKQKKEQENERIAALV
jgi:hypothetical protein